jgi:hypothetical protein
MVIAEVLALKPLNVKPPNRLTTKVSEIASLPHVRKVSERDGKEMVEIPHGWMNLKGHYEVDHG